MSTRFGKPTSSGVNRGYRRLAGMWLRTVRFSFFAVLLTCSVLVSPVAMSQAPDEEFESPAPRYPHIFVGTTDGAHSWPLIEGQAPTWSPDGTQIVFHREGPEFRQGNLYIIDRYGHEGWWIGSGIEPSWSPRSAVLFTSEEGISRMPEPGHVSIVTVVNHDFLTAVPWSEGGTYAPWDMGVGKPAWSPGGARIAFEHLGDGDTVPPQVFLVDANGLNVERLTSRLGLQSAESDPAWSPDGTKIAFWSYSYGLATVSLSDRTVQTIYYDFPTVAYGASPAWSPDGSKIAFVARPDDSGEPAIWIVDSSGGVPTEIIPQAYDPAWSPDGHRIAFVRDLPEPLWVPSFPAVSGAAAVYELDGTHAAPLDGRSRFVFFEDNTFVLQYVKLKGDFFSYSGTYYRTGAEMQLEFDDNPGDWQAVGTLSADERILRVEYGLIASLDGFEDGNYVLTANATQPDGPIKEPDEPMDPPPPPRLGCAPECDLVDY